MRSFFKQLWESHFLLSLAGKTEYRKEMTHGVKRLLISMFGVVLIAVFVGWLNFDYSYSTIQNILAEKGKMILLALEGGMRSTRRAMQDLRFNYLELRFQYLIEELAGRDAILFIAVTDTKGQIVAHTNPKRVGKNLMLNHRELKKDELKALEISSQSRWKLFEMEGNAAFVVYRTFGIPTGAEHAHQQKMQNRKQNNQIKEQRAYVFLGLDTRSLDLARHNDIERALRSAAVVLLVGWLFLFCLHALSRMRLSRQSQREAEAFIKELAITLPDGLILFNSRGTITQMNAVAFNLLGLGSVERQRKPEHIMHYFPAVLLEHVHILLRESTLKDTELILERDGHPVYLSVRGGQVGGDEGRLGSIMLLRDVSDVRRLEAEVRRREKLAAMGNLAAGVAHELRNPLSSIKGYATYFSERFPDGSEEREAAHVMVRETERLNRTISDLIGLARPTDIRVRSVNLVQLVEDAQRLIRQDAEAHNITLSLECSPVPDVSIDPDRVRQVVLNLCLNAFDAMPDGGTLTIALVTDESRDDDTVILEVRDTGTGIAAEHLPHIFDPYFTTKGHGTGLGLATVHKIMEAHGGSVTVLSLEGQGTTFQLHFHSGFVR